MGGAHSSADFFKNNRDAAFFATLDGDSEQTKFIATAKGLEYSTALGEDVIEHVIDMSSVNDRTISLLSNDTSIVEIKQGNAPSKKLHFKNEKEAKNMRNVLIEEYGDRRRRRIAGDNPALLRLLKQIRDREINHR